MGQASVDRVVNRILPDAGVRLAWMRPHRNTLDLPAEVRSQDASAREVVQALADSRGLKVAWLGPRHAVLHRGPEDMAVADLERDLTSPEPGIRREAAHRARFIHDVRVPGILARLLVSGEADGDTRYYAEGSLDGLGLEADLPGAREGGAYRLGWGVALLTEPDLQGVLDRGTVTATPLRLGHIWNGLGWAGTPGAVAHLVARAETVDPAIASHLARGISRTGRADLLPVLEAMMRRADPFQADVIATHLWRIPGAETLEVLDRLATSPAEPRFQGVRRQRIVDVLGRLGGAAAVERIQGFVSSGAPGIGDSVYARAMAEAGEGAQAYEFLAPRLGEVDPGLGTYTLGKALGETGDPRAVQWAIEQLELGNDALLLPALAVLDLVAAPDREVERLAAWSRTGNIGTAMAAIRALRRQASEKAQTVLVELLDDRRPGISAMARSQLGELAGGLPYDEALALCRKAAPRSGPDAAEVVGGLLTREEPAARKAGLELLEGVPLRARDTRLALNSPESLPFLAEALASGDGPLRATARLGLTRIGGPRAIELLIRASAQADSAQDDWNALFGLQREGSPQARAVVRVRTAQVLQSLANEGLAVRRARFEQLASSFYDAQSAPLFLERVRGEESREVQFAMAGRLAASGDPEALGILQDGALDPDPEVRRILLDSGAVNSRTGRGREFVTSWLAVEQDPALKVRLEALLRPAPRAPAPQEPTLPDPELPPVSTTPPWELAP